MRFALASYGTRGDIEPSVVIGRELQRRGHDVDIAVPPDLVAFAESAGLSAVPYGAETQAWMDAYLTFTTSLFGRFWRIRDQLRAGREIQEVTNRTWTQMSTTLTSLADGADLVLAGQTYQEIAANVAEHHGLPLVTLHHVPMRPNGQVVAILPAPASRLAVRAFDWLIWRLSKKLEDTQRGALGLPRTTGPSPQRIAEQGALELQAYDHVAFPGLAAEWAAWRHQRPFVGALTMELATRADEEAAAWISAGTPPIFFGFGSMPVKSPADTVDMISGACAELGERALIGSVAAVLIDSAALDPNHPLTQYVPELCESGYAGATVRHILDMRSGIKFREEYLDPDAEVRHLDQALGWVPRTSPDVPATLYEYLPHLCQQRPHGGVFEYRSCETDVLGWVCERAAGERMPELLSRTLWSRFAGDDMDAGVDRAGSVFHDGGLAASLRDTARFGELLRRGGDHIVPRAWIDDALTGAADSRDAFTNSPTDTGLPGGMYRNQFWVPYPDRRVLMCLGIHGQLIYVDFDRAAVVAKLSSWPTPLDPALDAATLALADTAADAVCHAKRH